MPGGKTRGGARSGLRWRPASYPEDFARGGLNRNAVKEQNSNCAIQKGREQ